MPSRREADEWDIREAVFRYQFAHSAASNGKKVEYYFLFLGAQGDPPASFIRRFRDHYPHVEPASQAAPTDTLSVIHKYHDAYGLIFKTTRIRWMDQNTVEVDGGYYEAQLSASGNIYRVERHDGRWNVAYSKRLWASLGQG